jgi:hypothetical protein
MKSLSQSHHRYARIAVAMASKGLHFPEGPHRDQCFDDAKWALLRLSKAIPNAQLFISKKTLNVSFYEFLGSEVL